jgi:uncharacterized protein YbcC (UPF0753/DUF2309 family)
MLDVRAPRMAGPDILDVARRASRIVAPVWPLQHFVAVNPFLGATDRPFAQAAQVMAETAGARMTMPRSFYADAIRRGRLTDAALERALTRLRDDAALRDALPTDVAAVRAAALAGDTSAPSEPVVPTVAAVAGWVVGLDLERFVVERVSNWAASYFDRGQASWRSPWRDLPPYPAWRAETLVDRTANALGIGDVRGAVAALSAFPAEALTAGVARLGLSEAQLEGYLQRATMSIAGWAAYARYLVWESELRGEEDDTLLQVLAVRVSWDVVLLEALAARGADAAWRDALAAWTPSGASHAISPARALDLVLQEGYDIAYQRTLVAALGDRRATPATPSRPAAQAAFCIDVRSEVLRRHLEAVTPAVETIGFAGFFGFAIEYVPAGQLQGGAQCPVLLTPSVVVAEAVQGADVATTHAVGARRQTARWSGNLWNAFKQGAVSCFGFVGPVGLMYIRHLVTDSLGLTRPVPHPASDGIALSSRDALGPTLELHPVGERTAGLPPEQRLAMAATVLRAMSLTERFGRLVLLAGHGSTTVNNPHATGLDCGACGGHTGEANARVAALVLNDPAVRAGLRAQGLDVPDDTLFLAGLHDTTTDDVRIFDRNSVPATHREELGVLEGWLAEAARRARRERAPSLGLGADAAVDASVDARTRDWAQVRPEWGLAGCAAFIAAPRQRTVGLDLGGRSFLHSYQWQGDDGFGVLELIMTAPMVVASWINLQYYGSVVDPERFGSGNKVLHNVVGTLGVLEGNGGDLRTGLPWQSVHDGTRFVHEPVRLNVVIEAPRDAMSAVIRKHDGVRTLLDHGWLTLWAMDDAGAVTHRYAGNLAWEPAQAA